MNDRNPWPVLIGITALLFIFALAFAPAAEGAESTVFEGSGDAPFEATVSHSNVHPSNPGGWYFCGGAQWFERGEPILHVRADFLENQPAPVQIARMRIGELDIAFDPPIKFASRFDNDPTNDRLCFWDFGYSKQEVGVGARFFINNGIPPRAVLLIPAHLVSYIPMEGELVEVWQEVEAFATFK